METADRHRACIRAWRARLQREQDELKKLETEARAQARSCAERLVARFGVRQVYLIGSLARQGSFHEGSDIDLAVAGLAPEQYWAALDQVAALADREVELIRLEDAGPEMAAHVAAEGILLT
jgi:predicted nucleotidyltransferase